MKDEITCIVPAGNAEAWGNDNKVEATLPLTSSEGLREAAEKVRTPFTLVVAGRKEIERGSGMTERLAQVARATGAAIVYSDYYAEKRGKREPHPVIDHEAGSLRDDFDMGGAWLARTEWLQKAARESDGAFAVLDEFVWRVWLEDARQGKNQEVALSELKARLWRMATRWSVSEQKVAMRGGEASVVERMAIYIAQNYARPLKIADIGKAVGLHPDYANHLFKKSFKCTLSDYVMEERIARAQRDLLSSQMGITEIAFNCGFNSISRFNAAFLKICGCTPREFRKHGGR